MLPEVTLGPSILGRVPSPLSLQALLFCGREGSDTGSLKKSQQNLCRVTPQMGPFFGDQNICS